MDIGEARAKLACAGYNEDEANKICDECIALVQCDGDTLEEEWERVMGIYSAVCEIIVEIVDKVSKALLEFADQVREVLDIESPNTKGMAVSKRLEYINVNRLATQMVHHCYIPDRRTNNMWFTRQRRKM